MGRGRGRLVIMTRQGGDVGGPEGSKQQEATKGLGRAGVGGERVRSLAAAGG